MLKIAVTTIHVLLIVALGVTAGCHVGGEPVGQFPGECQNDQCRGECGTGHGPRHNGCERLPMCNAPFFGHQPTCWHEWPAEWVGCQPVCIQPTEMIPAGEGEVQIELESDEVLPEPDDVSMSNRLRSTTGRRAAPTLVAPKVKEVPQYEVEDDTTPSFDAESTDTATKMSSAKKRATAIQLLLGSTKKASGVALYTSKQVGAGLVGGAEEVELVESKLATASYEAEMSDSDEPTDDDAADAGDSANSTSERPSTNSIRFIEAKGSCSSP